MGTEGACALNEALKQNSTLLALNLEGNATTPKQSQNKQTYNINEPANEVGDEGASALSEALKVNARLATLELEGTQQQNKSRERMPKISTI